MEIKVKGLCVGVSSTPNYDYTTGEKQLKGYSVHLNMMDKDIETGKMKIEYIKIRNGENADLKSYEKQFENKNIECPVSLFNMKENTNIYFGTNLEDIQVAK